MKFQITCTSVWDEAQKTFELYSKKVKPYQIEIEEIAGHKVATIKLETIEDLLKLSQKVKEPIVFNDEPLWEDVGLPVIEIYDGYRE